MHKNNDKSFTLLYIASDNRSGSTLLDMLLGNHSTIVSTGELRHLHNYYTDDESVFDQHPVAANYKFWLCSCGEKLPKCSFWSNIDQLLGVQSLSINSMQTKVQTATRYSNITNNLIDFVLLFAPQPVIQKTRKFSSFIDKRLSTTENSWKIVETIAKSTNAEVIVDSSKEATRSRMLYLQKPKNFKMIFLVRDGRAVCFSKMQRTKISLERAALSWLATNIKLLLLQVNIPRSQRLMVHYEDLCLNTEKELHRIINFIGISPAPMAMQAHKSNQHLIGGSPHRFDPRNTEIKLDDRWRTAFTQSELNRFNRIAGFLNRLLGYL